MVDYDFRKLVDVINLVEKINVWEKLDLDYFMIEEVAKIVIKLVIRIHVVFVLLLIVNHHNFLSTIVALIIVKTKPIIDYVKIIK